MFQPSERAQESLYVQLVAQKVKVPNSAQSGRCSLSDMVLGVLNMRMTIIVVQTTAQFCFWSCFLFCLGLGQLKLSIEKSSVPGPDDHMLWCH